MSARRDLARGYCIMSVREARRARGRLAEGDTASALNRLAWAWRYLTLAERGAGRIGEDEGIWRSLERAARVVDVVRGLFVETWPADPGAKPRAATVARHPEHSGLPLVAENVA